VRVAIVAGPDPARAFPAAALALGLIDNGDDVLLLTGRRWLPRLHQLGVSAEELAGVDGEPGSAAELSYRSPEHAATMTPAVRDRLADWRPDLVVADLLTLAGGFAAESLGLRWAQLHPHPLSVSSSHRRVNDRPGSSRGGGRKSGPRVSRQQQRALAAARDILDLPPSGPGPMLHMVATLPDLERPGAHWPRNASVVGPLTWDPAVDDLAIPDGRSPLVMVSPTTAGADRAWLLDAALKGLRGMRMVGTVLEPYESPVPWWANVGPGRQEPLLAQAEVVLTGGGHGTIVRALSAGVPLVLVPSAGELELARRVERLGAAVVLGRRASPRSLCRAVERVMTERSYASTARQFARNVAAADPVVLCHQSLVDRSVG